MTQATGTTVSLCPPLDVSDSAVLAIRNELEKHGFIVHWSWLGDLYNAHDPGKYKNTGDCPGNRHQFRVETPLDLKEEETQTKTEL
jgi:hypothetical protein